MVVGARHGHLGLPLAATLGCLNFVNKPFGSASAAKPQVARQLERRTQYQDSRARHRQHSNHCRMEKPIPSKGMNCSMEEGAREGPVLHKV